jgi:hypothetical protein
MIFRSKYIVKDTICMAWPSPRLRGWGMRFIMILVCPIAYLLVKGSVVDDVCHQDRQEISDTLDTSGESSIRRIAAGNLAGLACGLYPLPSY